MREIKFRIWDKKKKKLLYPRNPEVRSEIVICLNGKPHEHHFIEMGYGDGAGGDLIDYSERYLLLQFTGLKDKNDKDIYEGDIVEFNNKKGVIKYLGCSFQIQQDNTSRYDLAIYHNCNYVEVIGNIYENPELLK